MLHPLRRAAMWSMVVGSAGPAWGQDAGRGEDAGRVAVVPNERFSDVLTVQDQQMLAERLRSHVVPLRRRMPPPANYIVPGGLERQGAGLVLGPARVLTASVMALGWPKAEGDVLEVGIESERLRAAVGLDEPHLGLAVLDVPGLPGPPREIPRLPDDALWSGRAVYSVDALTGRLLRAVVVGPGTDLLAYYVRAEGDVMPLGSPVFGADGSCVSVVGRSDDLQPTTTWLLPPKALSALRERTAEWSP